MIDMSHFCIDLYAVEFLVVYSIIDYYYEGIHPKL